MGVCSNPSFMLFIPLAEFTKFLDDLCRKHNVECGHPRTSARLLDKVKPLFDLWVVCDSF